MAGLTIGTLCSFSGLFSGSEPIAFPLDIRYPFFHEDEPESSLVVARRDIGGQRSVML